MSVIGRSVPRLDGHAKVTGRALYTGDQPEMFDTVLREHGNGPGPYGAKGIGEGGIGLVAPAIAAAVARAVEVHITELPLTPERVWRAIRKG